MAGGGALGRPETVKRGKKSRRKKKKRIGFHLDMTPLVDITFLLLTFFMFTTTMLKPQVMEMKIPPESVPVEVRESELMTIYIRADNKLFYALGLGEPQPLNIKDLGALAVEQNLKTIAKNKLITLLKVDKIAKYATVINVLDELNIAEVPITQEVSKEIDKETGKPTKRQRKFTIAEMTDEEVTKIAGL